MSLFWLSKWNMLTICYFELSMNIKLEWLMDIKLECYFYIEVHWALINFLGSDVRFILPCTLIVLLLTYMFMFVDYITLGVSNGRAGPGRAVNRRPAAQLGPGLWARWLVNGQGRAGPGKNLRPAARPMSPRAGRAGLRAGLGGGLAGRAGGGLAGQALGFFK